jgi:hypothetical protein
MLKVYLDLVSRFSKTFVKERNKELLINIKLFCTESSYSEKN